jgi:glyoxylase-like metal-dependent hydrolase (beta-lactamase superfamily II)
MAHALRQLNPYLLSFITAFFACFTTLAGAEAPMVKTQVPGYYRLMHGQFEITALFDGVIQLDVSHLTNAKSTDIQKLLIRSFADTTKMQLAVNAYLINTGEHLVLVDAGGGSIYGPALGGILKNLKASGYEPSQVDTIIITHMHGDHIGGLIDLDNEPVFQNATVYIQKAESNYWLSDKTEATAPASWKRMFVAARNCAGPYLKNGKWKTFNAGSELVPGIKTILARGHTPGHTIVIAESQNERFLFLGDLMHNQAVQFARPDVVFDFDVTSKYAIATRQTLFKALAKSKEMVAGSHMPFPGIGHVRAEMGGKYTWVPIEFSPVNAR